MKTGFIYLWYDKKRKMFYLGCHVGKEDDGYICSSRRMRDVYRRRPEDFKRRILKRDIPRDQLLAEEHKWLYQIKDAELGKKYYNLSKHHFGHWANDERSRKSVGQKIAESPNRSRKISEAMKGKKPSEKTINAVKIIQTGNTYEKRYGKEKAAEIKRKLGEVRMTWKLSEESKQKLRAKRKIVKCPHCDKVGGDTGMKSWHFDNCKKRNTLC